MTQTQSTTVASGLDAVDRLIVGNRPFLGYSLPGSDLWHLCTGGDGESDFSVVSFDGENYALAPLEAYDPPMSETTDRDHYLASVGEIARRLKTDGGKTVYSRVIDGVTPLAPSRIASEYFAATPQTFRFIFMTDRAGIWIGASPELLGENDPRAGRFSTMALAGTRTLSETGEWDAKNIVEHQIVVDFIMSVLDRHGLRPAASPTDELRFGEISHLHTAIEASAADDFCSLTGELSPTPALAGWPRDVAVDEIRRLEKHSRGAYGGFMSVRLPDGHEAAYVNLRSVRLQPTADGAWRYNIFVGGGITSESVPSAEFIETEKKAKLLLDILKR